ncbi:MAG: SH3 domain-containing protein [Clostridia bacterium]|nr:SH3 domain-containing protein [Clostridia bacterium]
MFCDKCGLKLGDDDIFCGGCGKKVEPLQTAPAEKKEDGFAPDFSPNQNTNTPFQEVVPVDTAPAEDGFAPAPVAPQNENRDVFSGFEQAAQNDDKGYEDKTTAANDMRSRYGDVPFDQQGYNQNPAQQNYTDNYREQNAYGAEAFNPAQNYYPGENSYEQNYNGGNDYGQGYNGDWQNYGQPQGGEYGDYSGQNGQQVGKNGGKNGGKKGGKTAVIILILVAVLAAVGAGAYFFFFADKDNDSTDTSPSSSDVSQENADEGKEDNKEETPTFSGGVDSMCNVAPETTVDGETVYIRTQDGTYLRTGPGSDSIKTIKLEKGAALKVMGTSSSAEDWYYVKSEADGAFGWIEKSAVSDKEMPEEGNGNVVPDIQAAGGYLYIVPENGLKLRTGPGEDYKETTFLARGEAVKELGKHSTSSGWSYVEIYNGSGFGWVETSKLAAVNPETSRQNKYYQYPSTYSATVEPEEGLRLRAAASTDAEIYEVMDQGTVVTVIGYSAYDVHWRYIRVTINGTKMEGFVHNDYLIVPEG